MSNEPSAVNPAASVNPEVPSTLANDIDVADAPSWQQQVEQLQAQLHESERQRARDAESARSRQLALEDELKTRQNLSDRHRNEIEALQERLERQQLDLRLEQRRWEREREEWQAASLEAKDTDKKRVESMNRFRAELSLSRTTVCELQDRADGLQAEFATARQQWQEEKESLDARLAGYAETEFEAEQRWQEERETLAESCRAAEQMAREANIALEQQRSRCAELEPLSEQVRTLSEQLHDRDRELAETRSALQQVSDRAATLETELQQRTAASADAESLQQALNDERDRNQALTADLQAFERANAALQREFEQLRSEMSEQHIRQIYLKAALVQNDAGDRAATDSPQPQPDTSSDESEASASPPSRVEASRSRRSASQHESARESDESAIDLPQFVARKHGGS